MGKFVVHTRKHAHAHDEYLSKEQNEWIYQLDSIYIYTTLITYELSANWTFVDKSIIGMRRIQWRIDLYSAEKKFLSE